ncbi:MAG TPA: hypothetical protein EYN14_08255 [Alphaproteobacteria bacterium]|nr:hypothetical protein [Alphaproteobacteria bacterium]
MRHSRTPNDIRDTGQNLVQRIAKRIGQ